MWDMMLSLITQTNCSCLFLACMAIAGWAILRPRFGRRSGGYEGRLGRYNGARGGYEGQHDSSQQWRK